MNTVSPFLFLNSHSDFGGRGGCLFLKTELQREGGKEKDLSAGLLPMCPQEPGVG